MKPMRRSVVLIALAFLVLAGTAGGSEVREGSAQHGLGLVFESRSYRPGYGARLDLWGVGDSWYADPKVHTVDLRRPYTDHGVPRWYASYNAGFLHWLGHSGFGADVLSDDDLDSVRSGGRLARLYDLIVFAGHEEYVTP